MMLLHNECKDIDGCTLTVAPNNLDKERHTGALLPMYISKALIGLDAKLNK